MYKNKHLELLHWSIIFLRHRLKDIDKESYDLLNAIHNIPSLLESEKGIDDDFILEDLLEYEKKYLNWEKRYSKIIQWEWL